MNIRFEIFDGYLVLFYRPDNRDITSLVRLLEENRPYDSRYPIKTCFWVTYDDLYPPELIDDDPNDHSYFDRSDEIAFCVGTVQGNYIELDSNILKTDHKFFFDINTPFNGALFIKDDYISILKGIDRVATNDVYISNSVTIAPQQISFSDYKVIVKRYPGKTELRHYTNFRVAALLSDCFDNSDEFMRRYQKFISTSHAIKVKINSQEINASSIVPAIYEGNLLKLEQFRVLLSDFETRLNREKHTEAFWQMYIQSVIPFIFPKYILSVREMEFKKIDEVEDVYNRKPDFVLIDTNGFVDVMDIKVPEVEVISLSPSYRNNHHPTREFAASIVQVEKYVFCLNHATQENSLKISKRVEGKLPPNTTVRIMNPSGLLIAGRTPASGNQRVRDLELIKRQYKNVVAIMTYDDILSRLRNIVYALERNLD